MPAPKRITNLTARIFLKLIFGVFCVLVVALTAVDFLASKVAERTYLAKLTRELEEKNRMLALEKVAELGRRGDIRYYALAR
ncbi:MAG: hypothetical protein H7039_24400, partial [Bryobacteraceae bacterium]|nr:hypothetical protein [Bryobacteraceae bacterium]